MKKRRNLCLADARKPNLSREKFAGSGKVFYECEGDYWANRWVRLGREFGLENVRGTGSRRNIMGVQCDYVPTMRDIANAVQSVRDIPV